MASDNKAIAKAERSSERYQDLLKEDGYDDCGTCRLMGGGAFFGLAAYTYFSGTSQLERQRAKILASNSRFGMGSRKFGLVSTTVGLVSLGLWRIFG